MAEPLQGTSRAHLVEELLGLLHHSGEGLTRLAQEMAAASRSHPTDMAAISLLARRPAQLTVGGLGQELGLSKAATTSLVDRLEAAGHVHRVRDTGDRRRWHLEVTETAHHLAASILDEFLRRTREALASYSVEDLDVARRFLTDVNAALDPGG